ncbi:MAG: tRNA (guanosine(37)-N1)-methyltransferase TrmD, partial [Porticoccaceae bacterium]|nr:tRNA (guanosine(37)-N1)-methyltransferase TrmD [Porticoccaceae bacterium]
MKIALISLFPEMFAALTDYGISGRAVDQGLVELANFNPRDYTDDRHKTVDDRPYGGGPGMVMMVEPLRRAIAAAREWVDDRALVVYLSPQGKVLDQPSVNGFAQRQSVILIAGRYEGIDERLIEAEVDEEWSIGDYVLSGGEL